ncbi:MAG: ribosome maturation factor RimP [Sulfuricella sp.]|nr:ribosome maturation factor RimP [Sulfuricella sp.]
MDLYGLLESTVTGLGYEFVDLEVSQRGKFLRLFIDKPGGISVDDCAFVSDHLSRLLAVEMDYDYDRLEVSSPGLDRILKKEADFVRFCGERVQIKLRIPLSGRKNYAGVLVNVKNGVLELDVDGAPLSLNIADIDKARLIPNI